MATQRLLDSEWIILKALWGREPQSMKQIISTVQATQPKVAWSYKTYHSYLRIMREKGLVQTASKNGKDKLYSPGISQEDALRSEGDSLLSRLSEGSIGTLVAMMAKSGRLTPQDTEQLLALAEGLEKEGGGKK